MGKRIALFTLLFLFIFGSMSYAHSGRTDSSGGHNCSPKSQAKGLCSGYHYHNGGSSSSGSSSTQSSVSKPAATRNDKDCSDFATYDEVVSYWNAKGYSATYDPENLDGWGNGVVDDGIPCEAPSGYDKTQINNSPEQAQFKQDQQDSANGEKQGQAQGFKDGYQEASANSETLEGSEAFKEGYTAGYLNGYEEGSNKIEAEKVKAEKEGYALGKAQDNISIPEAYKTHPGLKKSFEDSFNKAVTERIEAKKAEINELGYKNGKDDIHSPPTNLKEIYLDAYQEGYEKAQKELEEEYFEKGYEAAFTMLEYKEPQLANEKFATWYKEGFNANQEIEDIKNAGLSLGKDGENLSIPSEFANGEVIFKHYYQLGYKEYEEQQKANQATAAGGAGLAALSWLGRRLYVAKKMIS